MRQETEFDKKQASARLREEILSRLPGLDPTLLTVTSSLPSTNTALCELAKGGAPDGSVLIALSQTAGRGRQGRSFFSPDGTGLYVSFLFRPTFSPEDVLLLTPTAAVCTAEAIESTFGVKTGIKWVNDVFLDGKKVAGILTDAAFVPGGSRLDFVVLGIGVNLAPPQNGFPDEIADVAGAVLQGRAEAERALAPFAAALIDTVRRHISALPENPPLEEYRRRAFFLGDKITLCRGTEEVPAHAAAIDERFRLVASLPDGTGRICDSGEIRIKVK